MVGYEFRKVIDDAGAYCNGDYIQFLEIILKLFDVLPLCEQFRVVEHEWSFSFHTCIPEIAVHCLTGHFESVVICHDYGFLSGKEFFEHVRNLGHTAHSEFHSLRVSCFFERIIYLSLSEINAKKLMQDIDQKVAAGDVEGAKTLCRNTRGPVASICYQGLMHISESLDDIERSVSGYGTVQAANLEKGCSWIKLFIAMAPSLGFLGTVIGMVMSFDQIQQAGDISPTIVASGMKVALITTIFGIIVALILQVFYNYILSKVEHLTSQMEESAVTLMDIIAKNK